MPNEALLTNPDPSNIYAQEIFDSYNNQIRLKREMMGGDENSIRYGVYQTDAVKGAIDSLNSLKSQYTSGKIDENTYYGTLNSVMPTLTPMVTRLVNVGGKGSGSYGAFNSLGMDKFYSYNTENLIQSTAMQMAGRYLNDIEMAQVAPAWQGTNAWGLDPNTTAGNQAIASLAQRIKTDPNYTYGDLSPTNAQNQGQKITDKYGSAVSGQFKNVLGREATSDELQHFSTMLATGQTDSYGLQSFLKTQPEYQNAQDVNFRNDLSKQLTESDAYAYQRMGAPQVASQFAQTMGGQANSPALDSALVDLQQKMSANRSNYLAQVGVQQYGGNKGLAAQDYASGQNQYLNNMYGQNQGNINTMNSLNQMGYNNKDYATQMNDYLRYLDANKQSSNNMLNYLNTGANVINAGANLFS